LTGTKKRLLL